MWCGGKGILAASNLSIEATVERCDEGKLLLMAARGSGATFKSASTVGWEPRITYLGIDKFSEFASPMKAFVSGFCIYRNGHSRF